MDTESERVYDRMHLYHLLEAEPTLPIRQLSQRVGRSERWVRKWKQRFAATETVNFTTFQSQSRAPKTRPRQTSEGIKERVCDLRESLSDEYHRAAGAKLIGHYLLKDETLVESGVFIPTSSRTITKILRERGYIRCSPKREHEPLELMEPMEEWEMDFCETQLVDGRFEFFLVVDRGTSRVVHVEGGEGYRADTALLAVIRLFSLNGLPKRLRFDRDPRFVWSWSADSFPAPLVKLLHGLGVEPVICPPRRPDKKPYVERCVRTFKHEWLDRFSLETMADCYAALEAFPTYYNSQRIHMGRACDGRTPDEAFPHLPVLPALPEAVQPNQWLISQNGRAFRRRIRANGTIQVDKQTYYIGTDFAKRSVLVHLDAQKQCLWVTLEGKVLPDALELKDLYPEQLPLQDYLKLLQKEAISIAYYRHMVWMQSSEGA